MPPINALRRLFPDLGRRTLIMGVINVTPDSFSDGGAFSDPDRALDHALRLMDDGADLLDIGGESTRPGASAVSVDEELARVLPVIERLVERGIGPVSIDTTKAEVARRAVRAGAKLVNDVSGLGFDPGMAAVVAAARVPVVLMHTRGRPKEMQQGAIEYEGGVVAAVKLALAGSIARAEASGIAKELIVVDPGLGFGKTVEHNLDLIRQLGALRSLGCPVLVGPSRKSFLGKLTGREVDRREFATAAAVSMCVAAGADIVRVHDVEAMGDVVRVTDAIARDASGKNFPSAVFPAQIAGVSGDVSSGGGFDRG